MTCKAGAGINGIFQWSRHLVIKNVDALQEAADQREVIPMHGQINQTLCGSCGHRWAAPLVMQTGHSCPTCQAPAARPDVVWFGEMPYRMEDIFTHLAEAEIFAAIGTSGHVYPAAGFVEEARAAGALTVELNLEPSAVVSQFEQTRFGPASEIVPAWVAELLQACSGD